MSDISFNPGGGVMCNAHRRMGATDSEDCTLCAREETEEKTRARTLAECKAAVEALVIPQAESGVRSNTGFRILALFSPGGPLDPGSEGEP